MNTRILSATESKNLAILNDFGFSSALLFLTNTGLEKSILDATTPMRTFFQTNYIHDYSQQNLGTENKVIKEAQIWSDESKQNTKISFYRPNTKNGDPRFWITKLSQIASGGDVVAVFAVNNNLQFLNLSKFDFTRAMSRNFEFNALATQIRNGFRKNSDELLEKLLAIAANGPIGGDSFGDTAIGMCIEKALGIKPNSSRRPDYKGIEIKSGRSCILGRENRATLFACVPDWSLSEMKSSAEILNAFGYQRENSFKLYCTVSAVRANSQGLSLRIVDTEQLLCEVSNKKPNNNIAVWRLSALEDRLSQKHNETFWIKADSVKQNGKEKFQLREVIHTSKPNVSQFGRLLVDGSITMDHLIKRKPTGAAAEKGPLFKIDKKKLPELFFGKEKKYTLY